MKTPSKGLGFFLHRSKVQRLYRSFLKVCDTREERREVRQGFDGQLMSVKAAEARLQSLQLARGGTLKDLKQHPLAQKLEWPWQKKPQ